MDLSPREWFSVIANDSRRKSQKYKSEMDKWSLKWNSPCGVLRQDVTSAGQNLARLHQLSLGLSSSS